MAGNLVSRSLLKMRNIVAQATGKSREPSEKTLERIRHQLEECAIGLGGEISTRQRAARLADTYLKLDDAGRHAMLRLIALDFGPNPETVAQAHAAYQEAVGTDQQWNAEAQLRAAMRSQRLRILTQFNAIPQGVKFLVDLRADLLRFVVDDPLLKPLDRELENRLTAWFDVGFLELRQITWESPAALLERVIKYEAVHAIHSWQDLKNRLDSDRRCYAFFHPRMPLEPLIFVETALTETLADNVQRLLDINAPLGDPGKADAAIFYSITNTQAGLRGVSFGNFLLKRVLADLQRDFPRLRTFSTLSPLPGLIRWARQNPQELGAVLAAMSSTERKKLLASDAGRSEADLVAALLDADIEWPENEKLLAALHEPLLRLAARYLTEAKRGDRPYDAVARFHLGNGARIERLNWQADTSANGYAQSWGIMVNYLYDPDDIEANLEAYARHGKIDTSSAVRRQARH
ncbi:malonyl-CoA decarboxylase [Betaproteobacteria bacterium]|nr:malonyl-CoA decarboxylase [Betaproteobacteria bacterium]GHT94467.1 malonyl-CoA decarboxylase [Betaproteobacteria bacterium]GHU04332.1 malonyl-CoA decarboxylase [Betaproteobacteria bacterium]GHU17702.1 malonyl-CoA decarboxylase [Betaproteobacteria bacterium]